MQQSKPLEFHGTAGGYFILTLVTIIAMYIPVLGWAFALNFAANWFIDNTTVNGSKVKYQASFGESLKFVFVNALLLIVTLGIYSFWFYPKLYRYVFDHTQYVDVTGASAPAVAAPMDPAPVTTDVTPQASTVAPSEPIAPEQVVDNNQPSQQPPAAPVV